MPAKKKSASSTENSIKIAKVGIIRDPHYTYYLDSEGDISCKDIHGTSIKVRKVGVKQKKDMYYYIDDEGDISAIRDTGTILNELRKEEKNVTQIFTLAGFKVTHNVNLNGVTANVIAEKGDIKIICECKFESSETSVKSSIYQWGIRKEEIGATCIIITLFGLEVLGEDREMAAHHDITLWEESNVQDFLETILNNRKEGTDKLMGELNLSGYSDPSVDHMRSIDF